MLMAGTLAPAINSHNTDTVSTHHISFIRDDLTLHGLIINSLCASDTLWQHRSRWTLDKVIACCLTRGGGVLFTTAVLYTMLMAGTLAPAINSHNTDTVSTHHISFIRDDLTLHGLIINSLCASDTLWQHRSRWTLDKVIACCLTPLVPSHCLNQCLLVTKGISVQFNSE